MVRDSDNNGGSALTATTTANNNNSGQNPDSDPNLKTLLEFKKTVQEEQKDGEKKIDEINSKLESVKKQIDEERTQLDDLRAKLKLVNEEKDAKYPKFMELRNSLIEAKNQMKTLDDKVGAAAAKSRKERSDMHNLQKTLEQIERDIQTKKLSKDEERKLVARSKEIATKLHTLKMMHKKEDQYRTMSTQYDHLKDNVNRIFKQKEEHGSKKINVISGVGVRKYYVKLGYHLDGEYGKLEWRGRGKSISNCNFEIYRTVYVKNALKRRNLCRMSVGDHVNYVRISSHFNSFVYGMGF